MHHTRRQLMQRSAALAGLGLLPPAAQAAWNAAAFDAKTPAEVFKALGAAAPTPSNAVSITGPDIAENGTVVPVGAATTLPGAKRLMILVEKNPYLQFALKGAKLGDKVGIQWTDNRGEKRSDEALVIAAP